MNGVDYGIHQDNFFYKLNYRFLTKARHVQSTQKRKFVKFLHYIKKKYCNCFCVLLWCKTFWYFTRSQSSVMFIITCFYKHSNSLDFSRSVPVCGMLSQCSGLNQFVLVFIFLSKKNSYLHSFSSAM